MVGLFVDYPVTGEFPLTKYFTTYVVNKLFFHPVPLFVQFSGGIATNFSTKSFERTLDRGVTYLLDDVNCTGNESRIVECRHLGVSVQKCRSGSIAGVICDISPGNILVGYTAILLNNITILCACV